MIPFCQNINAVSGKAWCAALFNSPTRELVIKCRYRRIEFGILPHKLFITKLFTYGFDNKVLRFIYDYLMHRKQSTRIGDLYSSWQEILHGLPQGSILGPLLFNVDQCDIFITTSRYDRANYENGNTPYVSGRNIE